MNKFFDNLSFIAQQLGNMVENGTPLPDGAAEKVAEFNAAVQKLEEKSIALRNDT
ncbi:MAG: hypothetical protein IJF18_02160 [Oscillospiraceae bacterium]|nr:hypothetical protein [Oscillospiraceae bacterium]